LLTSAAMLVAVLSSAGFAFAQIPTAPSITDRFKFSARSHDFEIRSEQPFPLEPFLDVAETTLWRTREWLGVAQSPEVTTLIYLTAGDESLHCVEREHALVPAASSDGSFRGRCYPAQHVIVIPQDVASMRWQVAHEVTHLVFDEIVGRNVEIVNEGLAELVPYWILRGAVGTPETLDAPYELYDARLARAVLERDVPTFDAFLAIDETTFYDRGEQWLWYALSWKLAKVLVESPDPLVHGRLRRFLDLLAVGNDVDAALRATYDERAIAAAWQSAIAEKAAWRPLFGDWRADPYGMAGTVGGAHSACVVTSESLWAGESFSLEVTLDSPPPDAAFGFAFDVRSEDEFVYVEMRPWFGRVTVAEHALGRWVRVDEYALDAEARAALFAVQRGERLTLHAGGRGLIDVLVDGTSLLHDDLGRALKGGAAGLMFENCDAGANERDLLEVHFRGATLVR
jgi:hypothetical protein